MSNLRHDPVLTFSVSVSIFGLLLVLMFALHSPTANENFLWRKPIIGSLFSVICISGIVGALFPKQCTKTFQLRKDETNFASHQVSATSKGHHPHCQEYSTHLIHINNCTFCAACTGLFLGALLALVGAAFYFFGRWRIDENFPVVFIGVVEVILGFFQLKFKSFMRLISNVFFVLGAFLVLVGIDELIQSLFVDLFLIVLIVFWLFTRIQLSRWDHQRICNRCKSHCEIREVKKKVGLVSAA